MQRSNRRRNPFTRCDATLGAASLPIFGEFTSVDWAIYAPIITLAVVLCASGIIILVVPAVFDHVRRWQNNRRMRASMQTRLSPPSKADAELENGKLRVPKDESKNALGWTADDAASGSSNGEGIEFGSVLGREKMILIGDDDPVVVLALSRRLQNLGYQVFRSPDAAHALMGAMKVRPDLVILDVKMPSGNGLAVAEMMASDPRYAEIPVIIHSVYADDETKERCRKMGVHHVEKSPHSWSKIKALVQSLLGDATTPPSPSATTEQPAEPVSNDAAVPEMAQESEVPNPEEADVVVSAERAEPAAQETDNRGSLPETPRGALPATTVVPAPLVCGRSRVLCIESPKDRLEFVERQLSGIGIEIIRVSDLEEGFWTCFTEKPHVIVIQTNEGEKALLSLLRRLAEHPVTRALPILVIDEGNAIGLNAPSLSRNIRVLKYPMEWMDLLSELEKLLPVFGRDSSDPLTTKAMPAAVGRPVGQEGQTVKSPVKENPLTVLCIDDDPVVARSIAVRLQPYGITLKSALNGTQGYMMAATVHPDIILLDLKMPNGEGQYVLSKLKENDRTKDIPVIVLTIESHPGVRRQMLSVGAEAFLTKPVRWPELFAEMAHCIELPEQLMADYKLSHQLTLMHT